MQDETRKKPKKSLNDYARYSSMGFKMIAIILLGLWGGRKLDAYVKPRVPVFTIGLTLGALGAALYTLFKEIGKPNS